VRYLADPYFDEQFSWFVVPVGGGQVLGELFTHNFEGGSTAGWSRANL
jgi:hypothetical protein